MGESPAQETDAPMLVLTPVDEDAGQSTRTLAAGALLGLACILMGGDMLEKSLKGLRKRGLTLPQAIQSEVAAPLSADSLLTESTSDAPSNGA